MKAFVAIAAAAALLALPAAAAEASTGPLAVAVQTLGEALAPGAVDYPAVPEFYFEEHGNVWHESNGIAGLQQEPVVDAQGNEVAPADTFLAGMALFPF